MVKRIIVVSVLVIGVIIMVTYIRHHSNRVESETQYDILYMNSNGDKKVNLTEDDYETFFGNNDIYIAIVFNFGIDESYIQQEMSTIGEFDTNTRNAIIQNYYSNTFDEVIDKLGINDEKITSSRYTPFMWVNVTTDDYDKVQDYLHLLKQCESVDYVQITEEVYNVPATEY